MILEKVKQASLVDLLTIVTPFVIIMGLMNKVGIYTSEQVDASWFISIFSPIDFMISDLTIYFYFALALVYLDKVTFSPSELSSGQELFWANVKLFSAFGGIIILQFWTHKSIYQPLMFYVYTALSLNGFGLIFLSKHLGKILGFGLLLLVPCLSGNQHADKLKLDKLPIVELDDNKKWHLLDKHSDRLILINKLENRNEFKVVEMKEIKILK